MATINDFKLVNKKSEKYFQLVENDIGFVQPVATQKQRERLGFYFFMLDNLCGISDIDDLVELISDTDFNYFLSGLKYDDLGVDSVFIDDDNKEINLFNFKFKESFKPDNKQAINDTLISTKFINALIQERIEDLDGKIKDFAKRIIDCLNSNDVWKFNLFVVSNHNKALSPSSHLKSLEETYELEIKTVCLDDIKKLMSIRPAPIDSKLLINSDALMSYTESSLSSSKSFIVRLSASELIRITCNDQSLRQKYNIENLKELSNVELDFSVLFDNVRGFVQKSKYNSNIEKTLKEEPEKFFMYNNGLTIVAEDVISEEVNAKKKLKLTVKNFQVLNGGQTLRTIHNFNSISGENISDYLADSEILIRIFKTAGKENTVNKIAEYTNSQNSISAVDLKSLSSEQIELEQYLAEFDILYARKSGDTGEDETSYKHRISMEKYGQILFALHGFPEKSSNQKKQIFSKNYSTIFGDTLNIEQAPNIIGKYFDIYHKYRESIYKESDQKVFFILYMDKKCPNRNVDDLIDLLEEALTKYKSAEEVADARKLIQVKFREFIDEKVDSSFSN